MIYNRKFLLLHLTVIVLITVLLIMLYPKTTKNYTEKNSVAVYFVKSYGENQYKLTPVRRKVYEDENNLQIAINQLLKGPENNEEKLGYHTEIPEQTELIEIKETPERAVINLSKKFEAGGGSASMLFRLRQLTYTALEAVDKKPVYLELEGEQVKYIGGEGLIVPQPLAPNLNTGQSI